MRAFLAVEAQRPPRTPGAADGPACIVFPARRASRLVPEPGNPTNAMRRAGGRAQRRPRFLPRGDSWRPWYNPIPLRGPPRRDNLTG